MRVVIGTEIAIAGDQHRHSRCPRGLHVAFGVSDIHALRSLNLQLARGQQQRSRVRLALRQGVTRHDTARALVEAEGFEQRHGEEAGLVRDDAPADGAAFECLEHGLESGEQARVGSEGGAVEIEQPHAQPLERLAREIRKGKLREPVRAVRDLCARKIVGEGLPALLHAHEIQCGDHVGRGVEQCAVQIEQHGADRRAQTALRRIRWAM